MNVKKENLDMVIVRGINSDWFEDNFKEMEVYFGGNNIAVPTNDAYYIGFYLEKPISAITHIGIVKDITRTIDNQGNKSAIAYLSAIIKLPQSIPTHDAHAIRKHEYWILSDFKLSTDDMTNLRQSITRLS